MQTERQRPGIAVAGALASMALATWAGRYNPSTLVVVLFLVWVTLPFAVLAVAERRARGMPTALRVVRVLSVAVVVISVAIYGVVALGPPRPQPAFYFLVVPAVSLVVCGAVSAGLYFARRTI